MGTTLDSLEKLLLTRDCIILCLEGKLFCGCGKKFGGLSALIKHISEHKLKTNSEAKDENLYEYFRSRFKFPHIQESTVTNIYLPEDLTCVCLSEHDIGLFSANIPCYICDTVCSNVDEINKHLADIHRLSQVLVGQNILFEKPELGVKNAAFFCPMVKCKYNIAESQQLKNFKTFKQLKQHYSKVHASKDFGCENCQQSFATKTFSDMHRKSCGEVYSCQCGSQFSSVESLQTHCRRKDHKLDISHLKTFKSSKNSSSVSKETAAAKLFVIQSHASGHIPIAPKPSAMHINAAIALSELSASQTYKPKADIGIQTDSEFFKSKKSASPPDVHVLSPVHCRKTAVSTETQTKSGGSKKRPRKVSSQVQTMGEFTVKAKRSRTETMVAMGSQCRISPEKRQTLQPSTKSSVTTMTSFMNTSTDHPLNCNMSIDIPVFDDLWPLKSNTNGTQTSPRVSMYCRKLSVDSVDELAIPELENVSASIDPTLPQLLQSTRRSLGECQQFSTETQTDLDFFLESSEWGECPVNNNADSELPDVEKLLTTEMETQTHEGEENLLFANNCTQTASDDLFSILNNNGDGGLRNKTNLTIEYVCSAETQTSLTGFQGNDLLTQVIGQTDVVNNHIETQTQDIIGFITGI